MALHGLTWDFLHTSNWGFWKLCPLRYDQASLLNWMSVGSVSPFGRYQFTKLSFASQYASWSLWMTVVLCGWKCSIFVAFFGGATDTPVCCASCTRNVFELNSNVAAVLIFLPNFICALLHVLLLSELEPVAWNLSCAGNWILTLECHCIYWAVLVAEEWMRERMLREILGGRLGWVVGSFKVLCEGE